MHNRTREVALICHIDRLNAEDRRDCCQSPSTATVRTVGQWFQASRGREALSQFNGDAIFIDAASDRIWGGDGLPTQYGMGTLLHELLHKRDIGGGFNHEQMSAALSRAGIYNPRLYRNPISNSLQSCF